MIKQLKYILTLIATLFASVASLATCTATAKNADYAEVDSSSSSKSVPINAVGDLVVFSAWCYPGCTPNSVTLGGQAAVKTSISGFDRNTSLHEGQGFLYYILSSKASGLETMTFTATGQDQLQVSYIDFAPSTGCTFTHDVDSPVGSYAGDTNSSTMYNEGIIGAPSITPAAGDVLLSFSYTSEHVSAINSPWSCLIYSDSGETQNCFFNTTQNAVGYILSAASGSTANNMTDIHNSDSWQALITSFSIKSSGTPPTPPTGLTAAVH